MTTQTTLVGKGTPFKLSEIASHARMGAQLDAGPVSYSWHKKGKKSQPDKYALCVFFTTKILDDVRFRAGDKVDIIFADKKATFHFSPTNPFTVYKSSGTKFMMKVATAGIEQLTSILPDKNCPQKMEISRTGTGFIVCEI